MSQVSACPAPSPLRNPSNSHVAAALTSTSSNERVWPWERVAIAATLALAAWFRLDDLGFSSLYHAEAWRANWSYHSVPEQMRRFPPLQYAMLWLLQHTFGRGEWLLRLPGALAGIFSVALVYGFTRRLFSVRAAMIAAIFAAGHPVLIEQARQMKVFGLEALTVVVMVWTAWRLFDKPNTRNLKIYTIVTIVCMWFTFSGVFILGAWWPIIVWQWFRRKTESSHNMRPLVIASILLLMAGMAWYIWLLGNNYVTVTRDYYFASEEKAWPSSYTPSQLAWWIFDSCYGLLRYTLGVTHTWAPLGTAIGMLNLLALTAGLWYIWMRKRPLTIFLVLLVSIAMLAGVLKKYPFGEFRMMTFFVPLTAVVIGVGLSEIIRKLGASPVTFILIGGCLLIAPARAAKASLSTPVTYEHVRPVFEYIETHRQPQDALFIYYPVDDAFAYYWDDDSVPVLVQPRADRDQFEIFCQRFDQWIQQQHRVWFVFTHNWGTEREDWIGHLQRTYTTLDVFQNNDASCHLFSSASSSKP